MQKENYEINKIYTDEFGRVSGIFVAHKPEGKSSHDIVYEFRRKLKTKKVGHAGALDLYASGLLIILVGKATKLSDKFLGMNKEYLATVLFGISTDSGDIEGRILKVQNPKSKIPEIENWQSLASPEVTPRRMEIESFESLRMTLKYFQPEYNQFVPVFSSVKVGGKKLRELARTNDSFEVERDVKNHTRIVHFHKKSVSKEVIHQVKLPSKIVKIYKIELHELKEIDDKDITKILNKKEVKGNLNLQDNKFLSAKILVECSKGTYVRQLAVDIGERLGIPSMLLGLERTKIGDIDTNDIYKD